MPGRPRAHPTDAHLARRAWQPSTRAPRLDDLETPVDISADSLADLADLSDEIHAGGRLVGATLSGRAFVSLAGRFAPLTRVRLVAAGPVLPELAACPHLAHVEQLSLAGCHVGDAGAELLAASPYLAALRALDVSRNGLTPAGLAALRRSALARTLTALDITANALNGVGLTEILRDFPGLRDLGATVTCQSWQDLAASRRQFGRLALARSGLADADLARHVACDWLNISFNAVGDTGVASLAAGGSLEAVCGLDLSGNRLTAAAVRALAGRCPRLEWLGLRANWLGPDAWQALADPAAFPRLRRADCGFCPGERGT